MSSKFCETLKIILGLALLFSAGWLGFMKHSPKTILIFGVVFTVLYIQGKWPVWRKAWEADGLKAWAVSIAVTAPIQFLLAGLIYLVGLCLGSFIGPDIAIQQLSVFDYKFAFTVLLIIFFSGVLLQIIEQKAKY